MAGTEASQHAGHRQRPGLAVVTLGILLQQTSQSAVVPEGIMLCPIMRPWLVRCSRFGTLADAWCNPDRIRSWTGGARPAPDMATGEGALRRQYDAEDSFPKDTFWS